MREKPYNKQIEALTKISKAISSDLYLDDILKLVVTVIAEVMQSNICSLWILDEKDNRFKLRVTQAISKEYLKERSLKLGEGIVGCVAKEKKPRAILDVLKEPKYKEKELAGKEKLRSMLSVPLIARDKVIGVINCYTPLLHAFTETEIGIVITIASQAAVAIENTELMVKSKVIQEELEARKKIERAKGVLMRKEGLTEEGAYQKLKKYSMDNRKAMREVAEAIILVDEMNKPRARKSIKWVK